jgi:NAD(P)-dependent dehydrogenase (short-subunit alcohol dehydrogenase family)
VRRSLGDLSILVNVVGMAGPRAAIEDLDEDEWDKTIAVNLSGMFYTMKRAVPMLKANGGGSIVNFSTCSTRTGMPYRAPYIASKAGVEGLTKNCARELGPFGIRCNAILPGIINNDRFRFIVQRRVEATGKSFEELENDYLKYVSLRCKVELSEFADMVEFLTSPAGHKVTGELIALSGNMEWEE